MGSNPDRYHGPCSTRRQFLKQVASLTFFIALGNPASFAGFAHASNVHNERITFRNGVAQQTNFHDYQVLGAPDARQVHVQILANTEHPTSVGEIGTVVAAAAVGNAFAALTGKKLRYIPLMPDRVKQALA